LPQAGRNVDLDSAWFCEGPAKLLQISKCVPKTLLQVQWLQWPSGAGHGLEKVIIPAYRGSGVDAAV
jgi:hypothetical protein